MSNQEYCQKLHREYFESSHEFLTLDRELAKANGTDNVLKSKYALIKKKWQTALRNYWDFLLLIKQQIINPNDEVQLS